LRIKLGQGFWTSRYGLGLLGLAFVLFCTGVGVFSYYYIKFGRMIDARLSGQIYQNTSRVYAAPESIFTGEAMKLEDVESYLVRAGYAENKIDGSPGQFHASQKSIEIYPSGDSYFNGGNAIRIDFEAKSIARITSLADKSSLKSAELEPQVLTNLFDTTRQKRRLERFDDLPKILVEAVLSAEDKRFFEHGGFDTIRILGAAWADLRRNQRAQGASTIDMQVARSFFFTTKRVWSRKIKETLVALELDQRFTKQQIFELYANEVYLGNRGSFSIHGFGEAAQAYFGKDVRNLNVGECAFLAGIIRSPSRYAAAERHPEKSIEARDRVLTQMVENGYVTAADADKAKKDGLHFEGGGVDASAGPYFVDMVKDHLLEQISEADLASESYRIYTTLDPDLQRAAGVAVEMGAQNVDKLLAKKYALWKKKGEVVPPVQIALVAMDPQTGEIRALVGGRNYGESQLNHALARRQPGSAFKPFVYAAAFDNAAEGRQPVITPLTTVVDEPTTFNFDGNDYTPNNFGEKFYGTVTAREALIHSMNVATVKVAEMVGYDRVVSIARQMGLSSNIQATPAVALGAYEMTPIDVAAGYTAFATNGTRAEPLYIRSVIGTDGSVVEKNDPKTRPVLDPRVAYLVTTLMEDVMSQGTGAVVRSLGFEAPAAGKTGTSRDGWFAGFTSNLICVIWVGFDDNRDLGISGTAAAAPIWAEFMKRAIAIPAYKNTEPFEPPSGVTQVTVDPQSEQLATPTCPTTKQEVFIAGTEPTQYCFLHGGRATSQAPPVSWLSHLFGKGGNSEPAPPGGAAANSKNGAPGEATGQEGEKPGDEQQGEKKKGLLGKIFGIFGGSKKPADQQPKEQPPPKPNP
jgi:penicillin-binding protein 1B